MRFLSFINDHYVVITLIAIAWIGGILMGRKISGKNIIFIKNPFLGKKSAIIDDNSGNADTMAFRNEYVVNLILDKKKDFPYKDVSVFTMHLDNVIKDGKIKEFATSVKNEKKKKPRKDEKSIEIVEPEAPEISEEDISEIVSPNAYKQ